MIDGLQRAVARRLFGQVATWRHHGLGMLQGEVSEELRFHVWHPSLRRLVEDGFRDVHDHRFDLEGYVLHGRVVDVRYHVYGSDEAERGDGRPCRVWSVVHAEEQAAEAPGDHRANVRLLGDDARVLRGVTARVYAGSSYRVPRCQFHTTQVDGLTVTLVHRSGFVAGVSARVLSAPGTEAEVGIRRDRVGEAEAAPYVRLLEQAKAALQ